MPAAPGRAATSAAHMGTLAVLTVGGGCVMVVKLAEANRSFAWAARFRRLARVYVRLPKAVAGLTFLAFICSMLHQLIQPPCSS